MCTILTEAMGILKDLQDIDPFIPSQHFPRQLFTGVKIESDKYQDTQYFLCCERLLAVFIQM